MSVFDRYKALAVAQRLSRGPSIWSGLCLKSVRTELGIPPKYPSAKAAGNAVPKVHRHYTFPAPFGYPIFYVAPPYDHIVLAAPSDEVWSSDILRHGGVDLVPESRISGKSGWRLRRRYWATELNGVVLPLPPVHATPAPKPSKPKPVGTEPSYPGHPLKFGYQGAAVHCVQQHLKIGVTGVYDSNTVTAVKNFQRRHPVLCRKGLARYADGIAGPATYRAITGHR